MAAGCRKETNRKKEKTRCCTLVTFVQMQQWNLALTEFVSRRAERLQIPDVEVFNGRVFKKENGPGASARITISEKAHASINNRTFWPAPSYVRLWKFQDKTSAVTEVTDSILVSGGTERNSSTALSCPLTRMVRCANTSGCN